MFVRVLDRHAENDVPGIVRDLKCQAVTYRASIREELSGGPERLIMDMGQIGQVEAVFILNKTNFVTDMGNDRES